MFHIFAKWLQLRSRKRSAVSRRRRCGVRLQIELLECRLAPVVGSVAIPAPVLPGGPYDGVALLTTTYPGAPTNQGRGTGSLIAMGDGHYILTVAHNDPNAAGAFPQLTPGVAPGATAPANITFNLQRNGIPVNVVIPVDANSANAASAADEYVINNTGYVPPINPVTGTGVGDELNDISLWKLVDPDDPQPNRLLVAPFGAQQYQLNTATDEVTDPGTPVIIVGYGGTGDGSTGQSAIVRGTKRMGMNVIDAVGTTLLDQVELIEMAGAGNFTVSFDGVGQNVAVAPALTNNSTAAQVLAALNTIPALNGLVSVQAIPGTPGMWWVTFVNGIAIPNASLAVTNPATVDVVAQGGGAMTDNGWTVSDSNLALGFGSGQPVNDTDALLWGTPENYVAPVPEEQTISEVGGATGGTFRLVYQPTTAGSPQAPTPQPGGNSEFTAAIPWNATDSQVLDALEALPDLAPSPPYSPGPFNITGLSEAGNLVTVTTNDQTLVPGQQVVIAGVVGDPFRDYNGTFRVLAANDTTFTFTDPFSNLDPTNGGTATLASAFITSATEAGNTVTITTAVPYGFVAGQSVVVTGVNIGGYNGPFDVLATPSPTTFTYTDSANAGLANGSGGTVNLGDQPTIQVSGEAGGEWTVTFLNSAGYKNLGGADVNQLMVANNANVVGATDLTGGTAPGVAVTTTVQGTAEVGYGGGDSGGPNFINGVIAGITQAGGTFGAPPECRSEPHRSSYVRRKHDRGQGVFL